MPIDVNLANWNKENENYSPLRTLPPRLHGKTSASAGTRFTPKNQRSPFGQVMNYSATAVTSYAIPKPSTGTPKCRKFLKRTDLVAEEPCWTKIRQVFSDEFIQKDDDQIIMDELLTLCSWWSEKENFAKGFESDSSDSIGENDSVTTSDDDDEQIFADVTKYLRNSQTVLRAVNRNESNAKIMNEAKRSLPLVYPSAMRLTQLSSAEFDLDASF